MQSNMQAMVVVGMDALVIRCSQTWTLLKFGHTCFGQPMQPNMNVIMLWAWMLWSSNEVEHERWMLWSSDAVEHERYYGLGMEALVIRRSLT